MALGGGFKKPKDDARFAWTAHVVEKMRQYGIPESRIRRIIRHPARTEEGIAQDTVAVMQPGGTTRYHEIWVMYKLVTNKQQFRRPERLESEFQPPTLQSEQARASEPITNNGHAGSKRQMTSGKEDRQTRGRNLEHDPFGVLARGQARIRVITAWRYPGHSPERNPVPENVIREIQALL